MPEGADYERGVVAGEIAQRLHQHDGHFTRINGSIADTGKALDRLTMQVQRLADAADADRAKAVALATGLKDADEARRNTETQRWSPLTRLRGRARGRCRGTCHPRGARDPPPLTSRQRTRSRASHDPTERHHNGQR